MNQLVSDELVKLFEGTFPKNNTLEYLDVR